ncbi:protein O-mannosyl-transferase TMTC1 [Brachionichthys hirsutus]|uniref:protein O-mannosyl-transferase TMTC1 n=1 Tax=Brachionichthys hirsutus TaxID=412623 RepID=UPI003604D251
MADNTSHKSYRPLCVLTFKLNVLLHGMAPLSFHVVNVALHCAVTCLLMFTCERFAFEDPRLAFVTALLFAVHPVHTEAVSGVVGRADVLACLLFLLTFLTYTRSVGVSLSEESLPSTVSAWRLLASLLLGTCAMLVKETGVTVFGVCVLYDGLVLCRKPLIRQLSASRLDIRSPFIKRAGLISGYVLVIMSVRLWLMGGSMPLFSEQDNPASFSPDLLTRTRSPQEAERYYRRALALNRQHSRALFNLGNLLKSQGKEEEAAALLKDSIRFGPHFSDAYSSLASLYADQKRFAEANEIYLAGVENCADSSDLHNNYGVFLVDTGEGDLAAAHYQEAIRLKPAHYVAMVNLGRLLRSYNENKEAESWYKRALMVTRKVDILTPLGALYYNTGRYEEALRVYREAVALQPDSTDIWLALAQVLAMADRTAEAEKMTVDIISREGSCVECYRLLSAIYSKRGDYTEALGALDRALQQRPGDPAVRAELHFSKGNQLREMNRLEQAFESYKLAVELKPDQSQAWMNMGGIQHMKGNYAAARTYYQQALLLTPGSKLLMENLAKLDRLERRPTGGA